MNKKIYALIGARGNSKGVLNKNIRDLGGHPLIAWSIIAAKKCKLISRVIVSTDSEKIMDIAKNYEAESPFLRPAKFATDEATDLDWILHALEWFKKEDIDQPDLLVHLRPTTPLRDTKIINKAIIQFLH